MSFINCGSCDQTNILQYTKLCIEIVEVKILFNQRLRGFDSLFSYKGVESSAAIDLNYIGSRELFGPGHCYNNGWA